MQVLGSMAAFLSTVKPPRKLDSFPGYCSPGVRSRNTEQEAPSKLQPGPLQSVRSRVYSQDARSAPPWPGHPRCRAPPTSQDSSGSAGQAGLTWAWPLLWRSWLHLFCSPTDSEADSPASTPWLRAWRPSNRTLGVNSQRKCLLQRVRKDTCSGCARGTHTLLSFFSFLFRKLFVLYWSIAN